MFAVLILSNMGKAEGLEIGRAEGLEIGRAEGEHKASIDMARSMKADGMSVEMISKYTGLSAEEIEKM